MAHIAQQEDLQHGIILRLKQLKHPEWTVYTVGSNGVNPDNLFQALNQYGISTLIDIRLNPFDSKHSDFRLIYLKQLCIDNKINYVWLGHLLSSKSNTISKLDDLNLINIQVDSVSFKMPNNLYHNNSRLLLQSIFNFIDLNSNGNGNDQRWCLFSFESNFANIICCKLRQSIANALYFNNLANIKNIHIDSDNNNNNNTRLFTCDSYIPNGGITYDIASNYLQKIESGKINAKRRIFKQQNIAKTKYRISKDDLVFTTALCIMPNKLIWPKINGLRSKHDKAYPRWMPHINIFYPFINQKYFSNNGNSNNTNNNNNNNNIEISKISQKFKEKGIKPFEITFNQFKYFERGPNKKDSNPKQIVYLAPDDNISKIKNESDNNKQQLLKGETKRQLQQLYDAMVELYPICQTGKNKKEFHAHCTVGQWNYDQIKDVINQLNDEWMPLSFECDCVYLIARTNDKDSKFEIKHKISFPTVAYDSVSDDAAAASMLENLENEQKKQESKGDNDTIVQTAAQLMTTPQ